MADVPRFERKTAFRVYKTGATQLVTSGSEAVVNFTDINYDLGNNFNLTTDSYVAPLDGIYAFAWVLDAVAQSAGAGRVLTRLMVNGVSELWRGDDMVVRDFASGDGATWRGSAQGLLQANDSVALRFFAVSGPSQLVQASFDRTTFAGYRIQSESRTILN